MEEAQDSDRKANSSEQAIRKDAGKKVDRLATQAGKAARNTVTAANQGSDKVFGSLLKAYGAGKDGSFLWPCYSALR